MLSKAQTLKGYKLNSLDGKIGEVKEFYFDDRHWVVRYLVAETGGWLAGFIGRQVLISPYALVSVNQFEQDIDVELTRGQIENSPSVSSDNPLSERFEEEYHEYYGWPFYWDGPYMWGTYPHIARDWKTWSAPSQGERAWDPHLRSTDNVTGYSIQAADGEIGRIEDFVIDDETWAIRYLIVDTRSWWPGKKILISPQWIERASWSDSEFFIAFSRETIKRSPEYTEASLLTRDYEAGLHRHYNSQGYWIEELAAVTKHFR